MRGWKEKKRKKEDLITRIIVKKKATGVIHGRKGILIIKDKFLS